jgi:hypothetical protein
MSTELTLTTDSPTVRDLTPDQYAVIQLVAGALHQSRYFQTISSEPRAMYLMARAYELGFPATAAPDVIDDIQGRLTLKPQAAWALVLRSGLVEDMKVDEGDDYCEISFKRRGLPFWQGYRFTLDAAKRAGLVKPDGAYETWTRNMLYWRALGFAIDRAFPDVTTGLKDSYQFAPAPAAPAARVDLLTGEIVEGVIVAEEG